MAEIKIGDQTILNMEDDALYRLGVDIGRAAAILARGMRDGKEQYAIEEERRSIEEEAEAGEAAAALCKRIEFCRKLRADAQPLALTPWPCIGCGQGMRFKPREGERCVEFVRSETRNNG